MAATTDYGFFIKQINEAVTKHINNRVREYGLTLSQVIVLLLIDDEKEETVSLKFVERRLCVSQPTALGLCTRLEQKGLLNAFYNEIDKRGKMLSLTEKGKDLCDKARFYIDEAEDIILAGFTEDEQMLFKGLLFKVKNNILSFS